MPVRISDANPKQMEQRTLSDTYRRHAFFTTPDKNVVDRGKEYGESFHGLKMYLGHREALSWIDRVAEVARASDAVVAGDVLLFVIPTYLQTSAAVVAFAGTNVQVGVQDVATEDSGAYTGEVSAVAVAEVGATLAEVGHAERRLLFGENDQITARKVAAAVRNGLTPVLCIGESERLEAAAAAAVATAQLHTDLDGAPEGPIVVAYEPVWAIGASEPAPADHIQTVTTALGVAIRAMRPGSIVIYGGSAGPGLLARLGDSVDGLFLGRFAHDVDNLAAVLDEAAVLARRRGSRRPVIRRGSMSGPSTRG